MKNKLSDLNDHLFAQIERLSDENLTVEDIEKESQRGKAMVAVSEQILRNADVQLQAARIARQAGGDALQFLPPGRTIEGQRATPAKAISGPKQ